MKLIYKILYEIVIFLVRIMKKFRAAAKFLPQFGKCTRFGLGNLFYGIFFFFFGSIKTMEEIVERKREKEIS